MERGHICESPQAEEVRVGRQVDNVRKGSTGREIMRDYEGGFGNILH